MRFGVYVPNFGPYGDAKVLADLAYEAEKAGWDGFFLWDQVSKTTLMLGPDPMVDPWVALAAIARRKTPTRTLGELDRVALEAMSTRIRRGPPGNP